MKADELINKKRRTVMPSDLRGEARKENEYMVEKAAAGELAGLPMKQIHEWCQRELGIRCVVDSFAKHFRADQQRGTDGKAKKKSGPARRRRPAK